MTKRSIYKRKKPYLIMTFFLIIFTMSITQVMASQWTEYFFPDEDYIENKGHVSQVDRVDADDDRWATIGWYTNWGKIETSNWNFNIWNESAEILSVRVRVEARHVGIGWSKFRAIVRRSSDNNTEWDSTYSNIFPNYPDWGQKYVTVPIHEVVDPDLFIIYIRFAKGMFCDTNIDFVKVKVRWE